MLTLRLVEDTECELKIFGNVLPHGERVALCDNDVICGIAVYSMDGRSVTLERIGVLERVRGKKYGDFFTRAMLYKLSLSHIDVKIGYVDDYYTKFGFVRINNCMLAKDGEIVFPSSCKGVHND